MTDHDVNPESQIYAPPVEVTRDPRLARNSQEDLHRAIDLAYEFASSLKELHPLAEKQIKGMIFQGNLI